MDAEVVGTSCLVFLFVPLLMELVSVGASPLAACNTSPSMPKVVLMHLMLSHHRITVQRCRWDQRKRNRELPPTHP